MGITKSEFIDNIIKNILLSATTEFICFDKVHLRMIHDRFVDLEIPFDCVAEGAETFSDLTGFSYLVVKPESALVSGARN